MMMITVSCFSSKEKKRHGPTNHTRVHIALKKFFSRIDWSKMSRPTQYVTLTDAQNRVLSNEISKSCKPASIPKGGNGWLCG